MNTFLKSKKNKDILIMKEIKKILGLNKKLKNFLSMGKPVLSKIALQHHKKVEEYLKSLSY